jgi:hypothetical protein
MSNALACIQEVFSLILGEDKGYPESDIIQIYFKTMRRTTIAIPVMPLNMSHVGRGRKTMWTDI